VNEVRQTLVAGSQMSTSLNTTLTTFDVLMKRFGVGETNQAGPPDTNSAPFRIQDYGQTAVQLEGAARQLTELLDTLDRTIGSTNLLQLSAQVAPAVQQAQTGGKEIVDYAFWKGILLLAIACGAVLVTVLLYRFLGARLTPATSSKSASP
jgi:type VI protein secretion system component VasF